MATPPQESARAVRSAPAKLPAPARAPRPDATAAAFPGLLAVALAQSLPPNLLGQSSGGNSVDATAGWAIAAGPATPMPPPTGQKQASGGVAALATSAPQTRAAAPPAQQATQPAAKAAAPRAMPPVAPPASETVAVGNFDTGAHAVRAASPSPNLLGQGDEGGPTTVTAATATAGWAIVAGLATAATSALRTPGAAPPVQPATQAAAPPATSSGAPPAPAPVAVGNFDTGADATGAATPLLNLLGQAGGGGPASAAAATAGSVIVAGPSSSSAPSTGRNQASGDAAAVAASAPPTPAAALPAPPANKPAAPPDTPSEAPPAPITVAVGNANTDTCATGAAMPQPNLLGQAGGSGPVSAAAAKISSVIVAGPASSSAPPTGRNQASGGAAAVAASASTTPAAAPPAPPATKAAAPPAPPPDAPPAPATVAVGSPDTGTYAPGPAAPPPATATPRQGLADAWQAANLALAAILAPIGQDSGAPHPGGMTTGAAVPDASGAGGQPGAAEALPATVSRQVTIQLLKQSGDATAPGGRLTLRLDPPQLGRVEVSFEQRGDRLLVTITAQTPEAERALRNGAGELQQALAGAGGKWQDAQVKIELASGRDEPRPDGDDGNDPGEQPSRRRQARDDG